MSHQAPIIFYDVAASFTEEQWSRLEQWQKDVYKNVMRDIHEALVTLGYAITNPDVLFNIKKQDQSCIRIDCSSGERKEIPVGDHPDILIRIEAEDNEDRDEVYVEPLNTSPGITTVVVNERKHQDVYDEVYPDSPQNTLDHGPAHALRDPVGEEYYNQRDSDESSSPISIRIKEEDEDDECPYEEELINNYSTADFHSQDTSEQQNEDFLESPTNKCILGSTDIAKMVCRSKVTESLRQQVVQMKAKGVTLSAIAREVGRSKSVISRILRLYNITNSFKSHKKVGRPRKTDAREDMIMQRISMGNCSNTTAGIAQQFSTEQGKDLSRHTVSRRLRAFRLKADAAVTKPH
ncbi:uncharacterized protein ACNLHF_002431 isoform 3-T3 [Anomaloglossus baeobatrachus]|uniref:uncharacterized protein LOC142256088 isoform X3 n=1 Tax=Anomaloglossus baeobatrachus TaxID=238106 RepID=UPI003F4FF0F6